MKKSIKELRSIFEKNNIDSKLELLNKKIIQPNFWKNKSVSQKVIKEKKLFEDLINSLNTSVTRLNDLNDLNHLAIEENNLNIQNEVVGSLKKLRAFTKKNEIKCFKLPTTSF